MLCSFLKVTFDSVVLVDWTHEAEFEPRLPTHSRSVQVSGAIRSDAVKAYARKNLTNTLQFSRVETHGTTWAATYNALMIPQSWPLTKADCTIEIRGSNGLSLYSLSLKDAAIVSAPGIVRNLRTIHTVTLTGGKIEAIGQGP